MENKVLAIAAGNEITEKDLNTIITRYPQEQRGALQSEDKKKQLIEQLISFELMSKFGKEIELDKTQEYTNRFDEDELIYKGYIIEIGTSIYMCIKNGVIKGIKPQKKSE